MDTANGPACVVADIHTGKGPASTFESTRKVHAVSALDAVTRHPASQLLRFGRAPPSWLYCSCRDVSVAGRASNASGTVVNALMAKSRFVSSVRFARDAGMGPLKPLLDSSLPGGGRRMRAGTSGTGVSSPPSDQAHKDVRLRFSPIQSGMVPVSALKARWRKVRPVMPPLSGTVNERRLCDKSLRMGEHAAAGTVRACAQIHKAAAFASHLRTVQTGAIVIARIAGDKAVVAHVQQPSRNTPAQLVVVETGRRVRRALGGFWLATHCSMHSCVRLPSPSGMGPIREL